MPVARVKLTEEQLLTMIGEAHEGDSWEGIGEFLGKCLKEIVCVRCFQVMPTRPEDLGDWEWKWPEVQKGLERTLEAHRPAIWDKEK